MQLDLLNKDEAPASTDKQPAATPKKPAPEQKAMDLLQQAAALPPVDEVPEEEEELIEDEGDEKAPGAFKTISEAAKSLSVPQHVLRFWESRFSQIKPLKMRGGRRYYRPEDMEVLSTIKHLLYKQGYTIKGARKAFMGQKNVSELLTKNPAPLEAVAPELEEKKTDVSDRGYSQLAVIRQELIGMRETLKAYL